MGDKAGGQFEILVVEDDADTRANLCDILELDGYSVGVAGSAHEARQQADWQNLRIVILDRKLPDATADDLLPEIKQQAPTTDVIVVTGFGDMDSTIAAIQHRASDYLIKPINPDVLRRSIERILERRRMERALFDEHELSDRILNTADAAVVLLDMDGGIKRINAYMENLCGWTQDEVLGKDWFLMFLADHDRDRLRDVFRRTAAGNETRGTVNPILTKEGKERELRWSNTALKDEDGTVSAVLAVGIDITELLEAQDVAVRSHRLAAIGETMTALAHESRNALQRIQAGLELLEEALVDNPEALSDIARMERATEELRELHEQIRSYAAPIKLEIGSWHLPRVWNQAWESVAELRRGRDATLEVARGDVPLELQIDAARFQRVFRNLFENALAACRDPVRITVTCAETMLPSGAAVEIRIRDNGPGLSCEQRENVFEAFFTTKSSGTGLGLSIVQRIVEAHGGSIRVEPEPEAGAEFVITIPRRNAAGRSKG